jgi:hypothetical protein
MFECKKCKSRNIVCNTIKTKVKAGNDFYQDKNFGKIKTMVQICWCSECGEAESSDILNIEKLDSCGSPLER